jgi:hypothetical protein
VRIVRIVRAMPDVPAVGGRGSTVVVLALAGLDRMVHGSASVPADYTLRGYLSTP